MFRKLAVVACLLLVSACASTNVKLADLKGPKPPAGSKILIVQPDVQLSMLTAGGLLEPRADWSQQARDNLAHEIGATMDGRSHPVTTLDASTVLDGRAGQLMRLQEAVDVSILTYGMMGVVLPTKKDNFDWTLGDGAKVLGDTYGADYALFTYGRGSFSSGGRKAAWLVGAALGVSIPMGAQQTFASLVDLRTGQVVWFNMAVPPAGMDMRTPGGAADLTKALLKDVPL
ncbi:MAG: hypothetical protein ACM3W4_09125 [Ignavibacteriales bacterium]